MKIIKYSKENITELSSILERSEENFDSIQLVVEEILNDVKKNGDKAIRELTKKFDGVELDNLEVTEDEILKSQELVSSDFKQAIFESIQNQYKFQISLLKLNDEEVEVKKGVRVWREWRPIERVGLYVPGGRARYPSSIVMVGVPAIVAGCKELVICTPVDKNTGQIPSSILVAVSQLTYFFKTQNLENFKIRIFKVGGAQAIGAMAYGTETIQPVYKIFGAGNSFVTLAKIKVFGKVSIDMPAGPSEVMIMADEFANPDWIASDLISQCEHGIESSGVLITNDLKFGRKVIQSVYKQADKLSSRDTILEALKNYSAVVVVQNWDDGINIVNEYAPEHLEIVTKNYMELKDQIVNVGSVFLGEYSTEPAGDYASGSNHVLPSNGYAKSFEGLSVDAFGKKIEFQELSREGLKSICKTINVLAVEEGLPAHANAINIRFKS